MINYLDSAAGVAPDRLHGFFAEWPHPPSPETHLRLLADRDHVVLAVDEETMDVVGFATAISDGVLSAFIPFVEVLSDYRSRGIG